MVRVGQGPSFCVDTTEVTRAQYQAFLDNASASAAGQDPRCVANVKFNNGSFSDTPGDAPATAVDWCDALAFCKWAGKRLCGDLSGDAGDPTTTGDPTRSQWYSACSRGGGRIYPNGNTLDDTACNTLEGSDGGGLQAVGTRTTCTGGYDGISDMVGNAWEWTDECVGDSGAPPSSCPIRGGSHRSPTFVVPCDRVYMTDPTFANDDYGFRCCAP